MLVCTYFLRFLDNTLKIALFKKNFFSWKKWLLLHTKIYNNLPQKLYCVLHSGLMKNKCQKMCISLKKNSRNVLIFAFNSKRHHCDIHPLILLNCIFISDFTPLCTLQLIRAHFYVKQKIFPWRDFMEIESPSSYFVWQYHPFMMQPFFAIEHIHTRYVCTYII